MRKFFVLGVSIFTVVLLAVAFSQSGKVTNVEATLRPPDFDKASALIAKAGCSACHTIPAIEGAVGTLGPSWCEPAEEFQAGEKDLEFIIESIVDPLASVDEGVNPVMPTNFGETFNHVELTTLATFIATLNCE
ncbi:MAG TPA: hypothetical protein ENK21_02280 [Trueperaceae bacterium]|nr:hypothetical protein [Trueperaceae bacterium]